MLYLISVVAMFVMPIFAVLGMWGVCGVWTLLIAPVVILGIIGKQGKTEDDLSMIRSTLLLGGTSLTPIQRVVFSLRKFQILFGGICRIVLGMFIFYYFYSVYDWNLFCSLIISFISVWVWWILAHMSNNR